MVDLCSLQRTLPIGLMTESVCAGGIHSIGIDHCSFSLSLSLSLSLYLPLPPSLPHPVPPPPPSLSAPSPGLACPAGPQVVSAVELQQLAAVLTNLPAVDREYVKRANAEGLLDEVGLPLSYDPQLIQAYWSRRPRKLQYRLDQFQQSALPFFNNFLSIAISGGPQALREKSGSLAKQVRRASAQQLHNTWEAKVSGSVSLRHSSLRGGWGTVPPPPLLAPECSTPLPPTVPTPCFCPPPPPPLTSQSTTKRCALWGFQNGDVVLAS